MFFFFQAEDGIRDLVRSRGLGDVYKRQTGDPLTPGYASTPGAPRLRVEQTSLPKIPVVPILSLIHI